MEQIIKNVDVCVIGGAAAGLTAALRAKEIGAKKVLVIEKNKIFGGCARLALVFFAVNTPASRRRGYKLSVDELFLEHMTKTTWHCDNKLVREWYMGGDQLVTWLEAKGVVIQDVLDQAGIYILHDIKGGANALIDLFVERCQDAGVEMMTETRGARLLTDDSGAVTGVIAVKNEEEYEIHASQTIIATGSIGYNQELIKRFYPDRDFSKTKIMTAVKHNNGEGYLMAKEIGAANGHMSVLFIGPHNHGGSMRVGNIMRRAQMICVNRNGERFVDEALHLKESWEWMKSMALDLQPGLECFPIMDESIFRKMLKKRENQKNLEGLQGSSLNDDWAGNYDTKNGKAFAADPCAWLDKLEDDFKKEVERGTMLISDTLDEVADWIGADTKVLKKTIADYNTSCKNKYDAEFLKDPIYLEPLTTPPYYAFMGKQGVDTFVGGIRINHNMQVLNKELYPIRNLYAAGVATSGWANNGYANMGSCLGLSLYSGYTAGRLAAEAAL